nr:nitroreductase family protein [Suicoccus acidiformans]
MSIEKQLTHRSIRKYKDRPVEEEKVQIYLEVMNRTACRGMQGYSVIRITDEKLKEAIGEAIQQEYIKKLPELLIFIIDLYRFKELTDRLAPGKVQHYYFDIAFVAIGDMYLAAQNMMNAIETDGLGGLFLSTVADNLPEMKKLLNLPELTLPLLGLGFGYPDENPELSPRLPIEVKLSENTYEPISQKLDALKIYDEELISYYQKLGREHIQTYSQMVAKRITGEAPLYAYLLNELEAMGVDLCIND